MSQIDQTPDPDNAPLDIVNAPSLADAILYAAEQLLREKAAPEEIRPLLRRHNRYWLAGQIAASFGQSPPALEGEAARSVPQIEIKPEPALTFQTAVGEVPIGDMSGVENMPNHTIQGWSAYVCGEAVEGFTDENGINTSGTYTESEPRLETIRKGNARIEICESVPREELPQLLADLYRRVMEDLGLNKDAAQPNQGDDEDTEE